MLARRLIYGQSQSMDAEEAMINRLKVSRLAPTANKLFFFKILEDISLFVEPLIPYFELLVTSALGFQGGTPRVCPVDSTDSHLALHLIGQRGSQFPFTHLLFSSIDGSRSCAIVCDKNRFNSLGY